MKPINYIALCTAIVFFLVNAKVFITKRESSQFLKRSRKDLEEECLGEVCSYEEVREMYGETSKAKVYHGGIVDQCTYKNTCYNFGTNNCTNSYNLHVCSCKTGFEGPTCSKAYCREDWVLHPADYTLHFFGRSKADGGRVLSQTTCPDGKSTASAVCVFNASNNEAVYYDKIVVSTCNLSASATPPTKNLTLNEMESAIKIFESNLRTPSEVHTNTLAGSLLFASHVGNSLKALKSIEDPKLDRTKEIQRSLLNSLQSLADRASIPDNQTNLKVTTRDITMQVTQKVKHGESFSDINFYPDNISPVQVNLPGTLLDDAYKRNKKLRVTFFLYSNTYLFPATAAPVNSIVSTNIQDYTTGVTNESLTLSFKHERAVQGESPIPDNPLKTNVTRTQCVVLDRDYFRWTSKGCKLVCGARAPTCECNRLATFAMLIQHEVLPSAFEMAMYSNIGCTLSVVALLATIAIHLLARSLRKRKTTVYTVNISICLLISNLIFVTGIDQVHNHSLCYVVTALLHYFLLSTWMWMAANAYNMYRLLVKVIVTNIAIGKVAALCYIIPLIVVILNVGITIFYQDAKIYQPDDIFFESSYRARHMCWLHGNSLRYGFLLPVGILTVMNVILFFVVFSSITCRRVKVQSSGLPRNKVKDVIAGFTMITMMGLTWTFGFFMLFSNDIMYKTILAWFFTVFNCTQGILIFLQSCVRQQAVRKEWMTPLQNIFPCRRTKRVPAPNTNTTVLEQSFRGSKL